MKIVAKMFIKYHVILCNVMLNVKYQEISKSSDTYTTYNSFKLLKVLQLTKIALTMKIIMVKDLLKL